MRIAILGAGAVGGHVAARLAQSGLAVSVIARGAHLTAIRANGLTLEFAGSDKRHRLDVVATDDAASLGAQDLLIVSVKAHQLPQAMREARPLMGPATHVMFVMNGLPWWFAEGLDLAPTAELRADLDPDGSLASDVPLARVLWGVVTSGGTVVAPGIIRNTTPDKNILTFGYPQGGESDVALAVKDVFTRAGYATTLSATIRRDIWQKLLINAGPAVVATLVQRHSLAIVQDTELRMVMIGCVQEMLDIGKAIGIDLPVNAAAMMDPSRWSAHRPSLLQDFEAGRPLELATTIYAVRDIARAKGLAAPYLTTIAALVAARAADRPPGGRA